MNINKYTFSFNKYSNSDSFNNKLIIIVIKKGAKNRVPLRFFNLFILLEREKEILFPLPLSLLYMPYL